MPQRNNPSESAARRIELLAEEKGMDADILKQALAHSPLDIDLSDPAYETVEAIRKLTDPK